MIKLIVKLFKIPRGSSTLGSFKPTNRAGRRAQGRSK